MYRYRKTDEFALAVIIPPLQSGSFPILSGTGKASEESQIQQKPVLRLKPASESHTLLQA